MPSVSSYHGAKVTSLQIFRPGRRDGTWTDAVAVPEGLVVDIGDPTMTWTNDRWLSKAEGAHRPIVPRGS